MTRHRFAAVVLIALAFWMIGCPPAGAPPPRTNAPFHRHLALPARDCVSELSSVLNGWASAHGLTWRGSVEEAPIRIALFAELPVAGLYVEAFYRHRRGTAAFEVNMIDDARPRTPDVRVRALINGYRLEKLFRDGAIAVRCRAR